MRASEEESLNELLAELQKSTVGEMRVKVQAMVHYTDPFVPQIVANPQDEFLMHVGAFRLDATTFLKECATLSNGDINVLTRIKYKFTELKGLFEFLCALQGGSDLVERVHAAL